MDMTIDVLVQKDDLLYSYEGSEMKKWKVVKVECGWLQDSEHPEGKFFNHYTITPAIGVFGPDKVITIYQKDLENPTRFFKTKKELLNHIIDNINL